MREASLFPRISQKIAKNKAAIGHYLVAALSLFL